MGVHIIVMSPYTPAHQALGKPGLDRTVTAAEYGADAFSDALDAE